MLSFVGLRFAAFGQAITSNEVRRMNTFGPVIVRLSPIPLAICPALQPKSPNPTLPPRTRACHSALPKGPPSTEITPSLSSLKSGLAPSSSACHYVLPPSATTASSYSPSSVSSSPLGTCHSASETTKITPLPIPTEADFDFLPKLKHQELKKPVRSYGAGNASVPGIVPVEHKAGFIKINDDDMPSGWECSFIVEYLIEGDEHIYEHKEGNEDDEDWQMSLLGIYVVDE